MRHNPNKGFDIPVVSPAPSKPENPEPELTPEPERVTALEPTQTKRLIAGGFNQGAKSQLLRSQIELPAIKIYWYNKGFEAGKPRASVEQIADVLDARYKKYVMSTCLNGAQFNLDTAKLIKELWEAV